jgi:hypothetical protein
MSCCQCKDIHIASIRCASCDVQGVCDLLICCSCPSLLLVTNAVAMQRNLVDMLVQDLGYDSVSLPTLLVEGALAFEHSAADRALHFTVIEVRSKLLVLLISRYQ